MREAGAVERNADAGGKDGGDEAPGIADQNEPVAAKLPHGVAIVTFILEGADPVCLAQSLVEQGPGGNGFPEELFPIAFRLREILFLRDHAQAGHAIGDRNLPDPGVGNGKEVDHDIVAVVVLPGEDPAIVALEPGVDGVLVEYGILHLEFELVSPESIAAAGV